MYSLHNGCYWTHEQKLERIADFLYTCGWSWIALSKDWRAVECEQFVRVNLPVCVWSLSLVHLTRIPLRKYRCSYSPSKQKPLHFNYFAMIDCCVLITSFHYAFVFYLERPKPREMWGNTSEGSLCVCKGILDVGCCCLVSLAKSALIRVTLSDIIHIIFSFWRMHVSITTKGAKVNSGILLLEDLHSCWRQSGLLNSFKYRSR